MTELAAVASTAERIECLAAVAGLALSGERIEAISSSVEEMWGAAAHIRSLTLGETIPAAAFDPQWR